MRKRSKYKPKPVRADNMWYVTSGIQRVGRIPAGTTLQIKNHDAMNNIRLGQATRDDIDKVIGALNIAEALMRLKIGRDWLDELRAAQDALLAVGRRGVKTGKFILSGPELTMLNLAMEIHDAQLQETTIAQLEKAMDIVDSDIRNKRARPIIMENERDFVTEGEAHES